MPVDDGEISRFADQRDGIWQSVVTGIFSNQPFDVEPAQPVGTWHHPQTIARRGRIELELEIDGETKTVDATGDGPVDAAFNGIKQLFPHEARLHLFQVHAVTQGTDAQAEVTVRLDENGKTVNGAGADTDTIVASVKAYVHALNKLLVKREKTAPAALSA